ncbi:Peptidase family M23 [Sphingopyxis terrae subsp. ummariensis]|uniref:Peptidase family M23 n=2 Tax=Sphingopyxis terrae TaxID=33052 RepID=A0A1Y6FPZ0_9SPHN|nr:Peptidase family M23 [Sphingopyxis terrae subsp. ummariensis]
MRNASLGQKFRFGLVFGALALTGMTVPAAHAVEGSSDAGIVVPDEPDEDSVPGAPAQRDDSEAYAIFQAWKRLDTGLTANIGIAIPSRRPIEQMSLSSSYGMRVHPITGKLARHNGVDIPAPYGTPIYATADGIVGRAQRLGGYGNYVEIEHGNAIETRYGHMSSFVVQPGQQVKKGDVIGYVGSTGRSTGNHLHYEVRIDGEPVNPMPFVRSDSMTIAALTGDKLAMGGPE